jgi:hypothetical protein
MSGTRAKEIIDHDGVNLELTFADLTYSGERFPYIFLRAIRSRRMQWVGSEYAWRKEMHATFYLVKM